MTFPNLHRLGPRERQIMDAVHARGNATVAEVLQDLTDPPSYSAVRRLLAILEEKGHLRHDEQDGRYVYRPAQPWSALARSAMEQVVDSFFGGSVESAVATLLTSQKTRPSDDELLRLEEMIRRVRSEESPEGESDNEHALDSVLSCAPLAARRPDQGDRNVGCSLVGLPISEAFVGVDAPSDLVCRAHSRSLAACFIACASPLECGDQQRERRTRGGSFRRNPCSDPIANCLAKHETGRRHETVFADRPGVAVRRDPDPNTA